MWRPWGKSTVRIHSASSSSSPSSLSQSSPSLFSCSSFKDIQSLCSLDESPQQPTPSSPTKKPSVFHRVRLANSLIRTWSTHVQQQKQQQQQHPPKLPRSLTYQPTQLPEPGDAPPEDPHTPFIPGAENRVVVYFTSLRVLRPTFDACKSVLSILRAFRVPIDERDVFMDPGFISELSRVMGRVGSTLPRVFIGGRHVGGAEEVRQMHEAGELKKLLEGLPAADPGECHVCGSYRFVLCDRCDGSRKLYTEKGGFKVCGNCNENGLVRCPSCFTEPIISISSSEVNI